MKRICLLIFSTVTLLNLQAQNKPLKIKVLDEQNLNLPGAAIILDNRINAVSNETGVAVFYDVAPGTHNLRVTYMGYEEYASQVDITAATTELTATLISGVKVLDGVLVLGDRLKGQAKALNQQKNNANLTNIISADQIGRFPDANIGDAIKRVPGVTMQNDQGEARNIIIRGLAPDFVNVTLNGDRIPSAEGDNRRIQMDLIPADMVQIVEVNKTLLPEMDADAIGGSVNLVTRSAPDKFRFSVTGSGGYNVIREKGYTNFSSVLGGRVFKNKLGIVANAAMTNNVYGSDDMEAAWEKDDAGNVYTEENEIRVYDEHRLRRSFGLNLDYKINSRHTIYAGGLYNWRSDWENRYRLRYTDISPVYADEAETQVAGYTGEIERETKGGIDNNKVKSRRLEDQRTRSFSLRGEHLFNKAKLTWSSSYARASEERPNERYMSYSNNNGSDEPMALDLSNPERPFALPLAILGLADYSLNEITEQYSYTEESEWNNKINLQLPVSLVKGQPGFVKLGVRYSEKKKDRDNNFFEYAPIGTQETALGTLADIRTINRTNANYQPGSKYQAGYFADAKFLGALNLADANSFEKEDIPDEYLSGNYNAKEKITAGFIQLSQNITDKLSFIAGARLEHTKIDYTGNIIEDEENLKGITSLDSAYTTILPSVNLKYKLSGNTNLRAAWTTSLARPKYFDLVPYRLIDPGGAIAAGNPGLKPTYANNFDLMFEHYFKSVGIVSAGLFYKHLKNFNYTRLINNLTTEDYQRIFNPAPGDNPIPEGEQWDFVRPENGDAVNVYGFEIAFQRQLDFLPGFWKGFGIYTNYTYTKSNANGIYTLDGELREDVALPGTAPHMFNASLSYENKKFIARISANYTASYIDELGEDAFYDRYYGKQFFLDFNTSYAITGKLRVFAEINNITNQPLRYYQGIKERTMQLEYYRMRWNAGIKFDIF